jgi:hypothetical protein
MTVEKSLGWTNAWDAVSSWMPGGWDAVKLFGLGSLIWKTVRKCFPSELAMLLGMSILEVPAE